MDKTKKKILTDFVKDAGRYILLYDEGDGAEMGFPAICSTSYNDQDGNEHEELFITVFYDKETAIAYAKLNGYCEEGDGRLPIARIPGKTELAEILFGCACNGIGEVAIIQSVGSEVAGINCDVLYMLQHLGRSDDCVYSMRLMNSDISALKFEGYTA